MIEFCGSLGLKFTQEEAFQALDEMETSGKRDGLVTIEECASQTASPSTPPPTRRARLSPCRPRPSLFGWTYRSGSCHSLLNGAQRHAS